MAGVTAHKKFGIRRNTWRITKSRIVNAVLEVQNCIRWGCGMSVDCTNLNELQRDKLKLLNVLTVSHRLLCSFWFTVSSSSILTSRFSCRATTEIQCNTIFFFFLLKLYYLFRPLKTDYKTRKSGPRANLILSAVYLTVIVDKFLRWPTKR